MYDDDELNVRGSVRQKINDIISFEYYAEGGDGSSRFTIKLSNPAEPNNSPVYVNLRFAEAIALHDSLTSGLIMSDLVRNKIHV